LPLYNKMCENQGVSMDLLKTCPNCKVNYPITVIVCDRCKSPLRFRVGTALLGKYVIEDYLTSGGMSQIYIAVQRPFERRVALKVVLVGKDYTIEENALKTEAFAISRVSSPHVVSVYDYGELEGGHLYLALEYLNGQTLGNYLATRRRLPCHETIKIMRQICEALEAVHSAGYIHRDLKPSNIFLTQGATGLDFVKLLDFGLAHKRTWKSWFFKGSDRMGTPLYMSPEQLQGDDLDERTDLYSLGVIAYEMLSGKPPFLGADAVEARLRSVPVPLGIGDPSLAIPRALDELLMRLLAREKNQRPKNCAEVLRRLDAITTPEPYRRGSSDRHADVVTLGEERVLNLKPSPSFVGYEKQTSLFSHALSQTSGASFLWFLGQKGIGKTTLLKHFDEMATMAPIPAVYHRCESLGETMGLWGAIVRQLIGDGTKISERLKTMLGEEDASLLSESVAVFYRTVHSAKDLGLAPPHLFVPFLRATAIGFMKALCRRQKVCLLIDDAENMDKDSMEVLFEIADAAKREGLNLVVAMTSCPIEACPPETRQMIESASKSARALGFVLTLEGLSESEMSKMVDDLCGMPCTAHVHKIVRSKAGSNPMFAVHMVKHLASSGALVQGKDKVGLARGTRIEVPDAIVDLIEARLKTFEKMNEQGELAMQVLERVVLLGNWAFVHNIKEMLILEDRRDLYDRLTKLLDMLLGSDIVRRVPWSNDDLIVPSDPLIVAICKKRIERVGSMGANRMRILAAHILEQGEPRIRWPLAEHLAELYYDAGYYDRACDYLITAGESALDEVRVGDAKALFARAHGILDSLNAREDDRYFKVLFALAEVGYILGNYEEALSYLELMEAKMKKSKDPSLYRSKLELSALVFEGMRDYENAISALDKIAGAAAKDGDNHRSASALLRIARLRTDRGDNLEASRLIEVAEKMIGQHGSSRTHGLLYLCKGRLLRKTGRAEECLSYLNLAIEVFSSPKDFVEKAEALFFKGAKLVDMERREEAVMVFREGVALCESFGFTRGLCAHLTNLGTCLAHLGQFEEAREALSRTLAIRAQMKDEQGIGQSLCGLSDVALMEGDFQAALDYAEEAFHHYKRVKYVLGEQAALFNKALAYRGLGKHAEAIRDLKKCIETGDRDKTFTRALAMAHELLADIYESLDMKEEVELHRSEAKKIYDAVC
jgi:serine/threonine-protein kinase